eukprot:TRINITY_DN2335_c0_g3_i4.p1 TRINITY_DN2335_c0_g3~~TRINITY_DN2335_c0_g3_i4.p1  ORF type:complete len:213 (+),score=50.44 TRINITY_DN2335_c0_g3_i4:263-901(+)
MPLFGRIFSFFDWNHDGKLTLEQVAAGIDQLVHGSWPQKLQFLFFLTDMDGDGLVNSEEMEGFLHEFRVLYYTMAASVFEMRLTKVMTSSDLESLLQEAQQHLASNPVIVSTECAKQLDNLDTDRDLFVSSEEWMQVEQELPMLYATLLELFAGIVESERCGQFYAHLSQEPEEEPEPEPEPEPVKACPRSFSLEDLRNNVSFKDAMASVET